MKVLTFNFSDRVVKELRFNTNDINEIQKAEIAKSRLENAGFNLKFSNAGFCSSTLGYVKFNK